MMIWKLIRKNINAWQIAGYSIASVVGLAIVACAIQFYRDASGMLGMDRASSHADYLVLSRPVSMLSSLGLGSSSSKGITPEEIADLEQQPWVESVGAFTAANFGVSASVKFQGKGMWTYMFLEAVPDEFIDVTPDDWQFDPEQPNQLLPVIIPKDYLNLYNFGFASSRGLPQLTEKVVSTIPFSLTVNGNGLSRTFQAHIAGFSERINTIAVPYSFMEWANEQFSSDGVPEPSRLIVKLSDKSDPKMERYLKRNALETSDSGLEQSKLAMILRLISGIVGGVGIAICALALFILSLSISLLLLKNKEKNSGLLLLGYSPAQVSACYYRLVGVINASVLLLAVAIMLVASSLWREPLSQMGMSTSSTTVSIVSTAAIMAAITAFNCVCIYRSIKRAFRN